MWRCVVVCCWLLPLTSLADEFFALATHVSDGDTVWVAPEGGQAPRKLRLQGLDAPEICQAGGVASRDALHHLLEAKRLRVTVKYRDTYGRGLARILVEEQDVGAVMVRSGQAWSNRWHRSLGPYAAEEAQARSAHLGLFADPAAELPSDFRKRFGSCYPAR